MIRPDAITFRTLARQGNLVAMYRRIFSDQLTPVLAYRRLVSADDRVAPSFLFESVEGGDKLGRYSFIGAQPVIEIVAKGEELRVLDHRRKCGMPGDVERVQQVTDPLAVVQRITRDWRPAVTPGLPAAFCGGWVGFAGYDTIRYVEPDKLPFDSAPADDRGLPDLHMGVYRRVAVFDHVSKIVYAVAWVLTDEHDSIDSAYHFGRVELDSLVEQLQADSAPLPPGSIDISLGESGAVPRVSNFTQPEFEAAVECAREYIEAGDVFQVVLSQRFERLTHADPFEIYRALRVVNPSPYMIYLQAKGCILIASSPEILCRVRDGLVTNRPLAGTRKRGGTTIEDQRLERELLDDAKERAEHIMLVDLGRNDVGRVARPGSIRMPSVMKIERYSHVMHISSTVTGRLRDGADCWTALRAALPAGTVSGAPKVRAMQIIDEIEPTRRGPYGGGIGVVSFQGDMDIALALRTMVVPMTSSSSLLDRDSDSGRGGDGSEDKEEERDEQARQLWTVHLQAGAGIVADSIAAHEYQETVNKAAALSRAIDLAESAFVVPDVPQESVNEPPHT